MRLLEILVNVSRLSSIQWYWLLPFYFLSLPIWILTHFCHYRRIGWLIGYQYGNREFCIPTPEKQEKVAWELGELVEAISKYTPWPCKCLVQAILMRIALAFNATPCIIYIGISKPLELGQPLPSHAWVNVGRHTICGKDGCHTFKVIATFSSESL